MQFRLTYQGLLLAETNKGELLRARADHKHTIRKMFHQQLRRLWEAHPALRERQSQSLQEPPYDPVLALAKRVRDAASLEFKPTVNSVAQRFPLNDYRFVPLLTKDLNALCSIDVLFLRNEPPGSALRAGDIDNRLKTLFDALTMPADEKQLGTFCTPGPDENPFFCLLEDDALINKASVETDMMLQPLQADGAAQQARVIVTVRTSVWRISRDNIALS